jgi:uncharacterized protein (TIGR02996 family)
MEDEQTFIQAILANPTDGAPRLVFADWLEERGDPRGELLRIQTALTELPRKDKRYAGCQKQLNKLRSSLDSESLAWFNTLRYRTAFAALARPLTAKDGVTEERVAAGEDRLGVRLPRALRDYYLVAGHVDRFNRAYYRLLPPEEWDLASRKLVFLSDHRSNAAGGVKANDPDGNDPPVFWGYCVDDEPDWHQCQKQCSEFLVNTLYQQAVLGGMKYLGRADITPEQRAQMERTWPYVADGYVSAFGKNGQAVCVGDNGDLHVGGRGRKEFNALATAFSDIGVAIEEGS